MITAKGVASRRVSSGTNGIALSVLTMKLVSPSRNFHDRVRTRKLVKNGAITAISMRLFHRPALCAIA